MITVSATLTISGVITFLDNTKNDGDITGNAVFEGNAENGENGIIDGDATFNGCSKNKGSVLGDIIDNRPLSCVDQTDFYEFDPPLLGSWITNGRRRRLVIVGSRNTDALRERFGSSQTIFGGPWQPCPPNESCFAYPALYRPFASVSFVMDYEDRPNYLNYPGNPEPAP